MQDLPTVVMRDPRVVDAEHDWLECMSQAGFGLHSRSELDQFIRREVVQPLESMRPRRLPDLRELQDRERELALSTLRCDTAFIEVQSGVSAEVEAEFVRDNGDELERLKLEAYPRP
jgi:hypothetical protein